MLELEVHGSMDQRDFLTQLLDLETFDRRLESALDDATRLNEPLGLVMVDIDHFKKVNDKHGHPAGNDVLKTVADCLTTVSRVKGEAFRYGGEEFAILLPNHSLHEAIAVAERARCEVEAGATNAVSVTASFGVACFPLHGRDAKALVNAADDALYDAKHRGRNLVRGYGEPEPAKPGPREPERKLAQPGKLTDEQKTEMRRRVLQNRYIECPDDGAHLEVLDVTSADSFGRREFLVRCPDCGMSDTLSRS